MNYKKLYSGYTLKQRLSYEEELNCIKLMNEGNSAARGKLIEHNIKLVLYIVKRFENTGIDEDDLASVGTIGLIKGIDTFNPEKNTKLLSYIITCIKNEILMYIKKCIKLTREFKIDDLIYSNGNNKISIELFNDQFDMVTYIEDCETMAEVRLILGKLNKLERKVIYLYYYKRKSQKEIASILGFTQSAISKIKKRAIENLKFTILYNEKYKTLLDRYILPSAKEQYKILNKKI